MAALSARGHQVASTTTFGEDAFRSATPFLPYLPALSEFPIALWARLTGKHARLVKPDLLNHGHVAGWPRLRTAIAAYLRSTRGIDCQGEQIVLTSSSQQSLSLCARLLTERGDHALMEDPGNPQALAILRGAGLTAIPVAVDAHGMRISSDASFAGQPRLVYVTPAHQYPTGVAMSRERRQNLLDWAVRNEAWVFEDDDQSEFRYSGHPLPALFGTRGSTCVLHAGSFDKTLFPALSISYLVVPPPLVDVFARAQSLFGRSPTIVSQLVLCDFLESGHFVRHIRRMGECYRERRAALIDCLGAQFGSSIAVAPPEAGLALPVQWKSESDAATIAEAAAAEKLRVLPSSSFRIETPVAAGAILGFAAFDAAVLQNAVKRLADAIVIAEKRAKAQGALASLPPGTVSARPDSGAAASVTRPNSPGGAPASPHARPPTTH
jgi:GntR family transcriptional regulator/MocR family aminotransferase